MRCDDPVGKSQTAQKPLPSLRLAVRFRLRSARTPRPGRAGRGRTHRVGRSVPGHGHAHCRRRRLPPRAAAGGRHYHYQPAVGELVLALPNATAHGPPPRPGAPCQPAAAISTIDCLQYGACQRYPRHVMPSRALDTTAAYYLVALFTTEAASGSPNANATLMVDRTRQRHQASNCSLSVEASTASPRQSNARCCSDSLIQNPRNRLLCAVRLPLRRPSQPPCHRRLARQKDRTHLPRLVNQSPC